MKRFNTCLYSESQILTRKAVFFQLCGENSFEPYTDNCTSSGVFLNFCDDQYSAANSFSKLQKRDENIIVYSDIPLQPAILSYTSSYEKCSLIVCPKEYEIEQAGKKLRNGERYRTAQAVIPDSIEVPQPGGKTIKLTQMQRNILYYLACGFPQKVMAMETGTTEKYAAKTVARLKEIFGDCQTTEQLLANATLLL